MLHAAGFVINIGGFTVVKYSNTNTLKVRPDHFYAKVRRMNVTDGGNTEYHKAIDQDGSVMSWPIPDRLSKVSNSHGTDPVSRKVNRQVHWEHCDNR